MCLMRQTNSRTLGPDRRVRCRPDERGRADAGPGAGLPRDGFRGIIPSIRAGDFNVGMSSFTDTKEREEAVDFVTYFQAGTLWAQQAGAGVDPNNACGLAGRRAVRHDPGDRRDPGEERGVRGGGHAAIEKVVYVSQDDLNAALVAGEVDAMSADSPVTGFAVKTSAAEPWSRQARSSTPRRTAGRWPRARGWRSRCVRRWST